MITCNKYILSLIIFFSIVNRGFSQTEENEFECDCPHTTLSYNQNIQLNHVTFHGEEYVELIPIRDDAGNLYQEIQYSNNNDFYPVGYVSGSHAQVSAAFSSSCNHPLWIRGTFDDGENKFCFVSKYVEPQGDGDYYYPVTVADVPFESDVVDAFQNFEIYWEVSPDGLTYAHVGTSQNPLYVTYHEPYAGTVIHHSTIGNSCISAEGTGDPRSIVDAIYALYETRDIRTLRTNGTYSYSSLRYWSNEALAQACSSTSDLYLTRNGRSENFAELFVDMINVQGLFDSFFNQPNIVEVSYDIGPLMTDLTSDLVSDFSSTLADVTNANELGAGILNAVPDLSLFVEVTTNAGPTYPVAFGFDEPFIADPLLTLGIESTSMLYVKNFTQCSDNTFFLTDADAEMSYTSRPNGMNHSKLVNNSGLAAQGNNDPPSRFSSLFLVNFLEKVYDPSYGVGASFSIAEWEDKVIDGYGIRLIDVQLRNDDNSPPSFVVKDLDYIHKREDKDVRQTIEN